MSDLRPVESEHIPTPEQPKTYTTLRFRSPEGINNEAVNQQISVANSLLLGLDALHLLTERNKGAQQGTLLESQLIQDTKLFIKEIGHISELTNLQVRKLAASPVANIDASIQEQQQHILGLATEIGGQIDPGELTFTDSPKEAVLSSDLELLEDLIGKFDLMNHDMKTPLTSLSGYIQLAQRDSQGVQKYGEAINRSLTRLNEDITENSIRLAVAVYREPIQLPVLIDIIYSKLKTRLDPSIKRVTPNQSNIPLATVSFDRVLAANLGDNAGSNISDALAISGQLQIENVATSIEVEVEKNEQGLPITAIVSIIDGGKGYPDKILKDGFQRGVSGTREKIEQNPELRKIVIGGTGVGYGRLRERIEKLNGKFYPAKRPGGGGRTVLELPIIHEDKST